MSDALERILDRIDESGSCDVGRVWNGTPLHDALCLARAVGKLIDFGGGNLKLSSGRVFKFARTCDACQNAVRMFTRAGLESRFCVRCANDLAEREWRSRGA